MVYPINRQQLLIQEQSLFLSQVSVENKISLNPRAVLFGEKVYLANDVSKKLLVYQKNNFKHNFE